MKRHAGLSGAGEVFTGERVAAGGFYAEQFIEMADGRHLKAAVLRASFFCS